MKFLGKIEDGTSNDPINFGSDPWPWRRFVLSEYTLQTKVCTLRVLLVTSATTRVTTLQLQRSLFFNHTTTYAVIKVKIHLCSFLYIIMMYVVSFHQHLLVSLHRLL